MKIICITMTQIYNLNKLTMNKVKIQNCKKYIACFIYTKC